MSRKRDALKDLVLVPSSTYERPNLRSLQYAKPSSVQLLDGVVVVFRHADSPQWPFRYRIKNGLWHRQSTKKASLELAVEVACEAYDLARFRLFVCSSSGQTTDSLPCYVSRLAFNSA